MIWVDGRESTIFSRSAHETPDAAHARAAERCCDRGVPVHRHIPANFRLAVPDGLEHIDQMPFSVHLRVGGGNKLAALKVGDSKRMQPCGERVCFRVGFYRSNCLPMIGQAT